MKLFHNFQFILLNKIQRIINLLKLKIESVKITLLNKSRGMMKYQMNFKVYYQNKKFYKTIILIKKKFQKYLITSKALTLILMRIVFYNKKKYFKILN